MKKSINILIEPNAKNTYWLKNILSGINESAQKYNYRIKFILDACLCDSSKYVCVIGSDLNWIEETVEDVIKLGLQPIIVNSSVLPIKKYNSSGVYFELSSAIEVCTSYLVSLGKSNISLVGVNKESASDLEKVDAFLSLENKYKNTNLSIEYRISNFSDCLNNYLKKLNKDGTEGAICVNDTTAINLINASCKNGFNLPNDLFVIGMGNSFLGKEISIPLTTVDFNYYELGKSAVFLYHTLEKSPTDCTLKLSLPCSLITRESTAKNPLSSKFIANTIAVAKTPSPDYDDELGVRKIENVLQETDDLGRDIIFLIAKGYKATQIAEKLFFTDRGLRYRIKGIMARLGCNTREELYNLLNKVLN